MKRYIPLIFLISLITVLNSLSVYALSETEAAAFYNKAGSLYREGKYGEALEQYEKLMEEGIVNPDLYYNTANAAYRTDSLGKAVLYLEHALRLAPSDDDIIVNLAFINSIKQDSEPSETNPVLAFLFRHYSTININSAALWSLIAFAIAMFTATSILLTAGWKRKILAGAAILCGFLFMVSTGILIDKAYHRNTIVEAVIMIESANAYSGPGVENTHIFTVHEGTKVVIERHQDDWNLIRLRSGVGGWIESDAMEDI